jgi:hypothetical protein
MLDLVKTLKAKTEPSDGTKLLTTFYTYDSKGNMLAQTDGPMQSSRRPATNTTSTAA